MPLRVLLHTLVRAKQQQMPAMLTRIMLAEIGAPWGRCEDAVVWRRGVAILLCSGAEQLWVQLWRNLHWYAYSQAVGRQQRLQQHDMGRLQALWGCMRGAVRIR